MGIPLSQREHMNYEEFIESKQAKTVPVGFDPQGLNRHLFPFQKDIVEKACQRGRYAIFADCGLGKTLMQLEWAHQVVKETGQNVLILCPLAVAAQTISEGEKFGINVIQWQPENEYSQSIVITNYESFHNVDLEGVTGIVLDESSILKNFMGRMKQSILERCKNIRYKLACTATPSPNDPLELGNHSEFLDVTTRNEMSATYFIHDGGSTQKWKLKGHAEKSFYKWVGTWASVIRKPSDLGYDDANHELPPLHFYENQIETDQRDHGMLFNEVAVSATNFNHELRLTKVPRMTMAADLVNKSSEPFIVWVRQNEESKYVCELIPDAVEVHGGMTPEQKESAFIAFKEGKFRVLVTKTKIAQFGLNFQHCPNQIFASLDFSFEGLYQAVRRSYRFGQKKEVNIYIISTDTMENVIQSINRKQEQFDTMNEAMTNTINSKEKVEDVAYNVDDVVTDDYTIRRGDCVELIRSVPDESIGFSVFSPPFADLYTYSDYAEDMGNSADWEEFLVHFDFLVENLFRVIQPGRNVAVHCMDLMVKKGVEGYRGLRDFSGMIREAFEKQGFIYHSRVTIWKDPVIQMQRTKAMELLHKQVKKDSTLSAVGMPDYVLVFRKDGERNDPVCNTDLPVDLWQKYASPVWMDINQTRTLQYTTARDDRDEKHICPLQLDTIERLIHLYSNPNDVVFTPFMGIGSEVYQALKMNRRGMGFELKPSYYDVAKKNLASVIKERDQIAMF
jgi:DNA modification methylase